MQGTAEIPVGVLTADACIVEEQPDHLVLAIRVPKALVQGNLPFLAAVAERTGPQSPTEGRRRVFVAPATLAPKNLKKRYMAALSACVGLVAAGLGATALHSDPPPPVVIEALSNDTPVLAPDGTLILTMTGQRTRACKGDIERAILREDGATVWRTRIAGMGQVVTEGSITRKLLVQLPAGLTPGRYFYRYTVYSDCGDGQLHSVTSPDIGFEIRA